MKAAHVVIAGLALGIFSLAQSDVDTALKVEKAKSELPKCTKLLESSQALGSVPMHTLTFPQLDNGAEQLTHCAYVFWITGDESRRDEAGNESDRYDATASSHMKRYLKAKGLWDDFVK